MGSNLHITLLRECRARPCPFNILGIRQIRVECGYETGLKPLGYYLVTHGLPCASPPSVDSSTSAGRGQACRQRPPCRNGGRRHSHLQCDVQSPKDHNNNHPTKLVRFIKSLVSSVLGCARFQGFHLPPQEPAIPLYSYLIDAEVDVEIGEALGNAFLDACPRAMISGKRVPLVTIFDFDLYYIDRSFTFSRSVDQGFVCRAKLGFRLPTPVKIRVRHHVSDHCHTTKFE